MGTPVKLPPTLLFPVEILEVLVSPQQSVKRQQRLLKFKYWNRVPDGVAEEGEEEPPLVMREFYGFLESPYSGTIASVLVEQNDSINDSSVEICKIEEGCDHSVQYGGLCALCGESLDQKDYLGYNDGDRAPIAMSHDTSGLTVSFKEAERIETRTTRRLLADKRLVLVVDLDQTVIHASVNPEIGEWAQDESSPHYSSLKNVKKFALRERPAAGGGVSVAYPCQDLQEQVNWTPQLMQPDVRWYYLKLRDGLPEFLEEMGQKYEMHVYTMATRNYALEVTRAIDPTGKYFADRILSRDTSGSLLHKDLKRLFPVSTNMVTIIDDRGDVWNWSPHLVRCVPYQFWSNTGDINSQFLPQRAGLVTPTSDSEGDTEVPKESTDPATSENGNGEDDSESQSEGTEHGKDLELEHVGNALKKLHSVFYQQLKSVPKSEFGDDSKLPDVGKLLPSMKLPVFQDCVFLFSGFFPVGLVDLDSADIVQWVRSFGAIVVAQYIPSVTHVISRDPGTMKAREAAGLGKNVVQIDWVFKCMELWSRVSEKPYLWKVNNPVIPREGDPESEPTEEVAEVDANIANGFVRSLQRGDVNWDAMDEELEELLEGDESDEDEGADEEEEKLTSDKSKDTASEDNASKDNATKDGVTKDSASKDGAANKTSEDTKDSDSSNPENDSSENDKIDTEDNNLKRKREEEEEEGEGEFDLDLEDDWD